MTGGEIFGLCWLASVVAPFAWYTRAALTMLADLADERQTP